MDMYHLRLSRPLTQKALRSWESITYVYRAVLLYYKHLLLVSVKGRTLNEVSMWLDCYDLSRTVIMVSQLELLLSLAIYQFVTSFEHYYGKRRE